MKHMPRTRNIENQIAGRKRKCLAVKLKFSFPIQREQSAPAVHNALREVNTAGKGMASDAQAERLRRLMR